MLRLTCDLGGSKSGLQTSYEVEAGGSFVVGLVAEHVGDGKSTAFDTIILEILYNDKDYVLFTDPRSHPIVGELPHERVADAFDRRPLKIGRRNDPGGAFTNGSLLTLRPATGDFYGPYKTTTGRAGITSTDGPFDVEQGRPIIVMGGVMFANAETAGGESSVVLSAHVFKGNKPVAVEAVTSTVKVRPRAGRKPFDV